MSLSQFVNSCSSSTYQLQLFVRLTPDKKCITFMRADRLLFKQMKISTKKIAKKMKNTFLRDAQQARDPFLCPRPRCIPCERSSIEED